MANIIRIGGGGGSTPTLITKSITQNGTYNASSDNADGYSSVDVNVSGGGSIFDNVPIYSGKIDLTTGNVVSDDDYYYTDLIDAPNGAMIFDLGETSSGTYVGVEMCGSDGSHINYWSVNERYRQVNHASYYSQAPKLRLSFRKIYLEKVLLLDKVNDITYSGKPTIIGNSGGNLSKTLLYTFNLSQGGAWLNTQVDVSDIDVFMFEKVDSSDVNNQTIIKKDDIAVYTGGADVYTNVYRQNNKDMNVRIYNNILYVSYGSTGSSSYVSNVYALSLSDYI